MRFAWISVSLHAKTGYGRESLEIISRLIDKYDILEIGHESDVLIWGAQKPYRLDDGRIIKTLNMTSPLQNRAQAARMVKDYCEKYEIDYLIGLWDIWALPFLNDTERPFAMYGPIDAPLTDKWAKFFDGSHQVIAYSLYAYEQLKRKFPPSMIRYVPHGVNTQAFHPIPKADKEELRSTLQTNDPVPDGAFLFCTTQANVGPRKQLPLLLRTFSKFVAEHPEAHLYMHTNAYSDSPSGYDLPTLAEQFGIRDHIHFPRDNPIIEPASDEQLNDLYNAADVYISASNGEGFGLPVLEAMSAGLPAMCPDNSSHTELVKGRGWLAKTIDTEEFVDFPLYVPTLQEYPVVNSRSLLNCMNEAFYDTERRKQFGQLSRSFVVETYDWSRVIQQWERVLDGITEEITMFREATLNLKQG